MKRALLAGLAALVCTAAHATTYTPVTFDELVSRAEVIFVGEVADVRPFALTTATGPVIKTRVVFRVQDPVFGTAAVLEVLEFLGGEVGDVGLAVAGMPRFAVGDRRVVFARRERSINPIVGFTQGLLQVRRDVNGVDRVLTLDGMPVAGTQSFGARVPLLGGAPVAPMRLADFRTQIAAALRSRAR
ncbi:MAG: hypothetical protein FJW14_18040 [Acidimicrobiia bacterium]|nr:hypothetical protein [Acidimicrobiia bacterium]